MAEIEEALKGLLALPGAFGYVIFNSDGIPVKHHEVAYEKSVQYAALISDLVIKTKQTLKQLHATDNEFIHMRMRTSQDVEIIISSVGEYTMAVLQRCFGEKKKADEEEQNVGEKLEK